MPHLSKVFLKQAQDLGLNTFGVLDPRSYVSKAKGNLRTLLEGSGSLLLVGSGGQRYWEVFVSALNGSHSHLKKSRDPLDDWFENCAGQLAPLLEELKVLGWKSSAVREPEPMPFQRLALDCGMAAPGRLGVLLHPQFGPWLGLRLVFFLAQELPPSKPEEFRPCEVCPAPCQQACHGKAIGQVGEFNWLACTLTFKTNGPCKNRCDARMACPVGAAYAAGPDTMAYHMTGDKRFLPLK